VNLERRTFLSRGSLLAFFFLLGFGGGSSAFLRRFGQGPTLELATKGVDVSFNSVELGNGLPNACTPDVPDDFVGLRINVPEKVTHGKDQFVICGTFRFPADYVDKFDSVHSAINVVAVDATTHRPYATDFSVPGGTPEPRDSPPIPDPDWMEDHFIESFFNEDLLLYMEDLPRTTADYFVYAVLENHVSNVVRVSYEA